MPKASKRATGRGARAVASVDGALNSDAAGLALLQRKHGTQWVFSQRAANAPALAVMSARMQAMSLSSQFAPRETFWWWIMDEAVDEVQYSGVPSRFSPDSPAVGMQIAAELGRSNYVLLDRFLGQHG